MLTLSPLRVPEGQPFNISCRTIDMLLPEVNIQKLVNFDQWVNIQSEAVLDEVEDRVSTWYFLFNTVTDETQGKYRCIVVRELSSPAKSEVVEVEIFSKGNVPIFNFN